MATLVDRLSEPGPPATPRDYPWERWLDPALSSEVDRKWNIRHGEDFFVDPRAFRTYVYRAVAVTLIRGRRVRASTRIIEGGQVLSLSARWDDTP